VPSTVAGSRVVSPIAQIHLHHMCGAAGPLQEHRTVTSLTRARCLISVVGTWAESPARRREHHRLGWRGVSEPK
jgi:hypothetical protein